MDCFTSLILQIRASRLPFDHLVGTYQQSEGRTYPAKAAAIAVSFSLSS
jgi:hypothetical protein